MNLKLENINKRLNLLGAEDIRKRISEVENRLNKITDELLDLQNRITNNKFNKKTISNEINKVNTREKYFQKLVDIWQKVLQEEIKQGLVREIKELVGSLDLKNKAKILKEKLEIVLKDKPEREKLLNRLNQVFYQEQGVLVEYRPVQELIEEKNVDLGLKEDLSEDKQIIEFLVKELEIKSSRIQLLLEYNGKRVSPLFVLEQLDKDIELQKNILNEKDRELYEEIILNSVGRIIKARINRAEDWVRKIDQLMSQRNTSSGLTFSLRWKPLTAQWEEELDTKELVELLRLDPRYLKEQDMERIIQHFRFKINKAKELMQEKGFGETFHQIIKEMLDYRKWFSFTLYYQKTREKKKELTNNVFYTFSGGEKAMAMYIPLFSAAYSRYLEAREDAPYIISLDEAFAGVDENNIRDMFDLVEKLGFNYIMNSQALWGDYDTVSSLSICELVRPKNAPYVTVVRYKWNGKKKELILS